MKRYIFCLLCVLAAGAVWAQPQPSSLSSPPVEIRAVWMDRNSIPKTEQGIRNLIRKYARAGINMVHPEVIFNGYAAYKSSYLTQKDLWNGIDMLGILTDEAHEQGIEVHPWVWVFRTGHSQDIGGILSAHPDWAMVDKSGKQNTDNGSYWLDPCREAVRRTLLDAYKELVTKYRVDGIQLDYIRFPSPDYGYTDLSRAKYLLQYGYDPINIQPLTKPVLDWHLWRENLINTFVADVSRELRDIRSGIQISAAVASYPDQARKSFLQNWENWAANKWVDFLSPMDYTADTNDFRARVADEHAKVGNKALLAPGVGIYTFKGTGPMLEQLRVARNTPVNGVTIFATAYLDDARLEALRKGPFRTRAELPVKQPLVGAIRLSNSAKELLTFTPGAQSLTDADAQIKAAKNLMDYNAYKSKDVGTIAPTPPPIYIPDKVLPIPEAHVAQSPAAPVIDGKLDDTVWQNASRISLNVTGLGGNACVRTDVYLARDPDKLYIAYRCFEQHQDLIKAAETERDSDIFKEDTVEVFFDPEGKSKDYYQLALNAAGTKWDGHMYDVGWNPDWESATGREPDAWTAEITVPFASMKQAPAAGTTWRVNFCRNRPANAADPAQSTCWSATYGSFHTPERFGKLLFD